MSIKVSEINMFMLTTKKTPKIRCDKELFDKTEYRFHRDAQNSTSCKIAEKMHNPFL